MTDIKEMEKQKAELEQDIRIAKRLHAKERLKHAVPNIDKDRDSLREVYLACIEFVANYRHEFKKHKFVTDKQLRARGS